MKPKEQKFVKVEAPFIDEISGLAIVKILDKLTQSMMMLKVKYLAMLDIMNSSSIIVILSPTEAIGVLDLRSFGYLKYNKGYYSKT